MGTEFLPAVKRFGV